MENAFAASGAAAPRQSRAAMLLNVTCTKEGQTPVLLRVRNLSSTGLGGVLRDPAIFAMGEVVSLAFKQFGPVPARVVWVSGAKIGFAFDQPVVLQSIASARDWNGPGFDVDQKHVIADKCWRPGWSG
jgi:PilZ domain